jgi:hypothetical protein
VPRRFSLLWLRAGLAHADSFSLTAISGTVINDGRLVPARGQMRPADKAQTSPNAMNACFFPARMLRFAVACMLGLLIALSAISSPAQNPPDGNMHITLSAPNTYTVSVATDSLWEYTMEASNDLESWQRLDAAYLPGDGGVHSQRVIVPQGAIKAFFRYRRILRAGGASGDTLTDWDRIYSFNANTILDTDGDGVPDYLETSLATNPYDNLSFPWKVVRVDPQENDAGHPRDGAIVV